MIFLLCHILLAEFIVFYIQNIEAPATARIFSYHPENKILFIIGNVIFFFFSVLFLLYVNEYLSSFFVRVSFLLCVFAMAELCVFFLDESECVNRVVGFILKLVAFAGGLTVIFFAVEDIQFTMEEGFEISADSVFSSGALEDFNWFTFAIVLYIYVLPVLCLLISCIKLAVKHSHAKLRQMLLCALSMLIVWVSVPFLIRFMIPVYPFAPVILFLMILGISAMIIRRIIRSDASRSNLTFFLLNASQYLLPALIMGFAMKLIIPLRETSTAAFWAVLSVVAVVVLYLTNLYGELIIKRRRVYNKGILDRFEKELKEIDYNKDLDDVSDDFCRIIRRYLRTSAVALYTNDGSENAVSVYDSRGEDECESILKLDRSMEAFLLKSKITLLRKSDLDSNMDFGNNKQSFADLFRKTRTNAFLVIYSKQHIIGLMFMGRKTDNSDYSRYDISTFNKLYTYFFIFAYYLMNVASRKAASVAESDALAVEELNEAAARYSNPPVTEKYDVGSFLKPAAITTGDFYDSIELGGGKYLFVLGTISGNGLESVVSSMLLKETIHSLLPSTTDFKDLVVKVNKYIYSFMPKGTIFSGMFAIADFAKDDFFYINCGIQTISVLAADLNKIYEVQGNGRILGFVENISRLITVQKRHLKKDDIIYAYTDGIVDAPTLTAYYKKGQQFQEMVFANTSYSAERIGKFIYEDFAQRDDIEKDVSILMIKRKA